jgi:membrane-associated phospholipid phosphatase
VETVARPPEAELDPVIAQRSEAAWRRWLDQLGRRPERVAGFSALLALAFVLGVAAMYAFIRLADEVLAQQTLALDTAASALILGYQSPQMDMLMRTSSMFGSEIVTVLGLILLALFGWQRRWGAAVALIVVTGGAQLLNSLLKTLFHRTRPMPIGGFIEAQQYSFPSGHAMTTAAFYFFLTYLVWQLLGGVWRWVVVVGLLTLVILIGISRIYLQAHYLSDVLAGYVAGFIWTDTVIIASQTLAPRRRRTLNA